MNPVEYKLKNLLNSIIDVAFADRPENDLKRFKWFKLYVTGKEVSSTSGTYNVKTHTINLYNLSLGEKHLAKCALHELSHHIDWCLNGCTGHRKPFYGVYKTLIYASLNMNILKKEDFYDNWSSDGNKVRKIVEEYVPRSVEYKKDETPVVKIFNSFNIKDIIRERGYHWNNLEKVWEKNIEDIEAEKLWLMESGVSETEDKNTPYYTVSQVNMYVDAAIMLIAEGDTFKIKDVLKEYGFYFVSENRIWKKQIKASELDAITRKMREDERLKVSGFAIRKESRKH